MAIVKDGKIFGTEYATAGLVFGCMIALILIRHGFRGVSVGGISVGVK